MPAVISFVGWHDSGKTTVATRVVAELLRRGRRVAVVKSSKEVGLIFDQPGTDSTRYRQVGAPVLVVAPDQFVLQLPAEKMSLCALAHRFFGDMELVVGEGFKKELGLAKIEVFRGSGPRLAGMVDGVIAVAADGEAIESGELRCFSLDDWGSIADFLEEYISSAMVKS